MEATKHKDHALTILKNLQDALLHLVEENTELKKQIKSLQTQVNEMEARLMEANCRNK
jgi:hypothetical protein